jgi:hypothetical protein
MAKQRKQTQRVMMTLRPGHRGTKALVEQYGEQLVCVRYRYDASTRRRHTTVELIIASGTWYPPHEPDELVALQIERHEWQLSQQIRAAGGIFLHARKVWQLRYHAAVRLGLIDRIIEHE